MGITGLLKLIKPSMRERKISDYRGKLVAVDTYAWLHRMIKGPSGKEFLVGEDKYRFVRDIMRRIDKIQKEGVKLILVFDGGALPRKREEEEIRRKRREQSKEKGEEMLAEGDEGGYKMMVGSIDVTPELAFRLIQVLKQRGIPYIVAPYEADAQLAYLSREELVDLIITEDSDLLVFGAKRILYKFDIQAMSGQEISLDDIPHCIQVGLQWFTHCMFMTMCILSGCDYLQQIERTGLKTAHQVISRVYTCSAFLEENHSRVPPNYYEDFVKAFLTFRFQRVYCPKRKECVELNSMDCLFLEAQPSGSCGLWSGETLNAEILSYAQSHRFDFEFLGEKHSPQRAQQIAEALIHPVTYQPYEAEQVPALFSATQNTVNLLKIAKAKRPQMLLEAELMTRFLQGTKRQKIGLPENYLRGFTLKDSEVSQESIDCLKSKPSDHSRKGLRLNDDNDESESEEPQDIAKASEKYLPLSHSIERTISLHSGSKLGCRLMQIAENMFQPVFTLQMLRDPFGRKCEG